MLIIILRYENYDLHGLRLALLACLTVSSALTLLVVVVMIRFEPNEQRPLLTNSNRYNRLKKSRSNYQRIMEYQNKHILLLILLPPPKKKKKKKRKLNTFFTHIRITRINITHYYIYTLIIQKMT